MRVYGNERMRGNRSSLSAAQEREVTTRAIQNIVRRLGIVLGAALDAAIHQLLKGGDENVGLCEALRDALKPYVDQLVHFEVPREEDGNDAP